MERYSVIDIGSNSIRLMCCEVEDGKLLHSEKTIWTTKLGKGVHETRMLSQESMDESYRALDVFSKKTVEFGGKCLGAFATSAVRDSLNGNQFINGIEKRTPLSVEIVSGDREAKLGYLGVIAGISPSVEKIMVLDIGGGSTEVIFGDAKTQHRAQSINVGAVRMTDLFIQHDPPDESELSQVANYTFEKIRELQSYGMTFGPTELIGIGGTITTLQAMTLKLGVYDRERIHNSYLEKTDVLNWIECFKKKSLTERMSITGLQPKRADIIPSGATILKVAMESFNFDRIRISDYDNLEGLLAEKGILL